MRISMRKSNIRLIVLSAFYILYLVIGASIFSAIEGPQERTLVKELKDQRAVFLASRKQCLTDAELEEFIAAIVQATNRGISAVRNVSMSEPNWSFGQAMFFAGTVITTIGMYRLHVRAERAIGQTMFFSGSVITTTGYGRVTPLSEAGKGFCILYAVIGIPLTLILFTAIVERLMIPTTIFLHFLFRKLGHLYKVFHIQLLHLVILIAVVIIFIYLIPAAIYTGIEPNWNYLDAFYYCFISLTTIGLGDYIPGDTPDQPLRPFYKVATTFYLFIGLLCMMLILAVLYEIPELNIGFHFYMKSDSEDEERMRLHAAGETSGPKYTKQIDEDHSQASSEYQGIPGYQRPAAFQPDSAGMNAK